MEDELNNNRYKIDTEYYSYGNGDGSSSGYGEYIDFDDLIKDGEQNGNI